MQPWDLPSFDSIKAGDVPALPTVDELQNIRAKAHQEGFARGLQDGVEEGRTQGFTLGKQEGIEAGRSDGFQAGYQQGYQQGANDVQQHLNSLRSVLETLHDFPKEIEQELISWVYDTALKLSGQAHMDRQAFVAAVHEALMRLPRPGEQLMIRIHAQDMPVWKALTDGVFACETILHSDPELQPGQAHVEVAGVHLDVSVEARRALVKSALGLLGSVQSKSP
jgi:flagellar assembly protein FliH